MTEVVNKKLTQDTCMYVLMEAAHKDEQAKAVLLETLHGFTYMCQSLGCSAMKSYRGSILEKAGKCAENTDDASPPLSNHHTLVVIGGDDEFSADYD